MRICKIVTILLVIILLQNILKAQNTISTIAVPDFQNNSLLKDKEKIEPLRFGLADVMINALSSSDKLKVVERKRLKAILKEQALGLSGVLDNSSAQKAGQLLGAEYLLLGSYICGLKNDIRIDCRIVNTETGETVKAEEVSGKMDDLLKLLKKLSKKMIKNLNVKLSKQENQQFGESFNLCDQGVLNDYFMVLTLLEEMKTDEAVKLLDKVITDCPRFKRAVELREQVSVSGER